MTERKLLGILDPVLEIINNQDFKDPQHKEKIERIHSKVTVQLFEKGAELKVMQLRFKVNRRSQNLGFMPRVADKLPVVNSTSGWINEPDGNFQPAVVAVRSKW